jgi:P27 family predicted phage terminase small subunit
MEHGVSYKIPKKDADGKVVSIYVAQWPEVAIAKQSLDQVRAFCSEFGMSPSSRSRMSLPGDKEEDKAFEDLLD